MEENQDQINQLLKKLEQLTKQQAVFSEEINELRKEIFQFKKAAGNSEAATTEEIIHSKKVKEPIKTGELLLDYAPPQPSVKPKPRFSLPEIEIGDTVKADWEKFIGENLISKIGIFILVLGVGIGAKYSIDNDLISPLTRIIFGYLVGLGLMGVGIKLKQGYNNYSAVLVSGGLAIFYFITYFAYNFYGIFPQLPAFGLMVLFTIFSVVAALNYNQQVIALIGLVGAYGVPFLLGDGSGNIHTMFTYMAIINAGILIIAFKKYWKTVHRTAFLLTWFIYAAWFFFDYSRSQDFGIALTFAGIFFVTFYAVFLGYKLLKKEPYVRRDIWLLLTNSFLFYGFGYAILEHHEIGGQLLGLFTLGNAGIHFLISTIIHRQKLADKNLFYLVIGLVLVFLTIAIPVQLDGNWVTLIWAGEAALLFWIGRTKGVSFYEKMAYPLMLVAGISLLEDWSNYGGYYVESPDNKITPIFNIHFLTSLLFIAAFTFINWVNQNQRFVTPNFKRPLWGNFFKVLIPAILLVVTYSAFSLEIDNYFTQLYVDSTVGGTKDGNIIFQVSQQDEDFLHFRTIWLLNYTLFFLAILTFVNAKWMKHNTLAKVNLLLNGLVILVFLTGGLFTFRALQQSYLSPTLPEYFTPTRFNIGLRYISMTLFAGFLAINYKYLRNTFAALNLTLVFDLILHTAILVLASSELIYWMDMGTFSQSDKLGLSILWGSYSLFLVGLGIWQRKKHLRIAAMALFAVTLFKLFFYDLSHLETIAKTIVLMSLGLLLLIISFLYNKYKHLITDETEN